MVHRMADKASHKGWGQGFLSRQEVACSCGLSFSPGSLLPGGSWLGLLAGIEKVSVVLEGVLCPETKTGGI